VISNLSLAVVQKLGQFNLQGNITEALWNKYIQLTEAGAAFRESPPPNKAYRQNV
jgi:hypothetical protein